MEKLNQDFDPLSGLLTTSWFDNEGNLHVDYKQDLEKPAEFVRAARNDGEMWKKGIKNSFVHALHLEPVHQLQLRKIGIDTFGPNRPPLRDVINGLKKLGIYEQCDMTGKRLV